MAAPRSIPGVEPVPPKARPRIEAVRSCSGHVREQPTRVLREKRCARICRADLRVCGSGGPPRQSVGSIKSRKCDHESKLCDSVGTRLTTLKLPFVIVTGGPGAGKTTLLSALAAMGYDTVDDSARAIIAKRLARGASRRPDAVAFGQEILHRDIGKYLRQRHTSTWVFFDRSLIDALGLLHEASALASGELEAVLGCYPFYPTVFVLPPWEAIYATDEERDQSFADAIVVHAKVVRWYRSCGYALHEVPFMPVAQRAEHVLRVLAKETM